MNGTHTKLTLIVLKDDEEKQKHQGYTYLILCNGMSHSAQRTEEGLNNFLRKTGLKIGREGYWEGMYALDGQYTVASSRNEQEFQSMIDSGKYEQTEWLDNGSFTLALIEKGTEGNTIHILNPNCNRIEYPFSTHKHLYWK